MIWFTGLTLPFLTCQTEVKQPCGEISMEVAGLMDTIRSYANHNLDEIGLVTIRLKSSEFEDTTYLYIASTKGLGDIPRHYFVVDNRPVLVYTGLENLIHFDSSYVHQIETLAKPYIEEWVIAEDGTVLSVPSNYNPEVWKIDVFDRKILHKKIY